MYLGAARRKTFTLRPGDLAKMTGNGKWLIRSAIRLPQSLGSKTDLSVQRNLSCCSEENGIDPYKTHGVDRTYLAFVKLNNFVVQKSVLQILKKSHITSLFCSIKSFVS